MGKIVITEFVSLDGVVEDPGGIGGFKHRGWTFEIDRGEEGEKAQRRQRSAGGLAQSLENVNLTPELMSRIPAGVAKFKLEETLGTEALLLGRITYEEFAALWPSRDGEFADKFNGLPKYVVSSTLEDPEWNNSTVLEGDVVQEVSRLKQELDGDVVVHGSIRLARTLVEHDLVDELRLMLYPVVLGTGKRLFGETSEKKPMRLVDTKTVGEGVAILIYEPVRAAAQTSDGSDREVREAALSRAGIREGA
jgi:dihydrofolate reductase